MTNYACHIGHCLFTFACCWILATVGWSYLHCVHLRVTLTEFGCIKQAGEQTFSSSSLPPIMAFSGKYQQVSHENFEPFMKATGKSSALRFSFDDKHCCSFCLNACFLLGLPDEVIQQVKDIISVSEIEQNGNDFKVTTTTGPKVMVNKFTIGKETELDTISGEKIKVRQGNSLLLWKSLSAAYRSSFVSSPGNPHSCFMFEDRVSP